jgi:hypothetical protein
LWGKQYTTPFILSIITKRISSGRILKVNIRVAERRRNYARSEAT